MKKTSSKDEAEDSDVEIGDDSEVMAIQNGLFSLYGKSLLISQYFIALAEKAP